VFVVGLIAEGAVQVSWRK